MKLFLSIISLALSASICPEIESNNQELRQQIQSLKSQLQVLTLSPEKVLSDFISNKDKLNVLINEFASSNFDLNLADEIKHYLLLISEDISLLNYTPEDISAESIDLALQEFTAAINQARAYQQNKEFSKVYNQLMLKLDESQAIIKELQLENAQLLGKFESSESDNEETKRLYENEQNLRIQAENELKQSKIDHSDRIEKIENSISEEEESSRAKEILNFENISNSQNLLILQLRSENSAQILKIEQLSTEIANLKNNIVIKKNSIENLQQELKNRDDQLINSEAYFEDFRRKIELENVDQIATLRNSEE